MTGHSQLGASSAKRWLACAGSYLLGRDNQIEEESTSFARLGTAAHKACSDLLEQGLEPWELIGAEYDGYVVGKDIELHALQTYVDVCRPLMDKASRVLIEEHIYSVLHPLMHGTCDFAAWTADGLYIADYKNGSGVAVDPEQNEQLLYYAYLACEELRLDEIPVEDWESIPVFLTIVQPNLPYADAVKSWKTDLGTVIVYGARTLYPRISGLVLTEEVRDERDFVAGDHCQFCPAILDCPLAQTTFETLASNAGTDVDMLSDEDLSAYYAQKDLARRFITALEKRIEARLHDLDNNITTAKLVAQRTMRVWTEGAEGRLAMELGASNAYTTALKSPAQIEALGPKGKSLAAELAYLPTSETLVVASIFDKRDARTPEKAANTFAAFATPASTDLDL